MFGFKRQNLPVKAWSMRSCTKRATDQIENDLWRVCGWRSVVVYLDPLSLRRVGQLVHAALDVIKPGQQVMWLPPVLVPLGSDGQRLPVPEHSQVLQKQDCVIRDIQYAVNTACISNGTSQILWRGEYLYYSSLICDLTLWKFNSLLNVLNQPY